MFCHVIAQSVKLGVLEAERSQRLRVVGQGGGEEQALESHRSRRSLGAVVRGSEHLDEPIWRNNIFRSIFFFIKYDKKRFWGFIH